MSVAQRKSSLTNTRKKRNFSKTKSSNEPREPTEDEVNRAFDQMSMTQLRDPNGPYGRIPRSVLNPVTGLRTPKSQLRKQDLCRWYLRLGGKVTRKSNKDIKHWTPPRKLSAEEKFYEKIKEQRKADHHGAKPKAHTESLRARSLQKEYHAKKPPFPAQQQTVSHKGPGQQRARSLQKVTFASTTKQPAARKLARMDDDDLDLDMENLHL